MQQKTYENYPCWTIILSNLLSITIYFIGAFIIYQTNNILLLLYILFIIALEIRLMKKSCINCYYYGKYCAFGKGKLSALLFKKGNPKSFLKNKITWKTLIPDFLVTIIPLITGIILLIKDFDWTILSAVIILIILTSAGNQFIRGTLACRFCKQRKIGCPAEQLFNKRKSAKPL